MLQRLLYKHRLRRKRPGYHSRFGGLWTDRLDASAELDRRVASGTLDAVEGERLRTWIRDGYVILKGAVPHDVIDSINAKVEAIWQTLDPDYLVELGAVYHRVDPALRAQHYKLLDLHARFRPALEAAFAPALTRFLGVIFGGQPLLFQSLAFETGSTQPVHQDSAYVVVTRPLELAAAWIALEDIEPGSGELVYYPGSHRWAETVFRGGARNWNRERDGDASHGAYLASLEERAKTAGLESERFYPRKGDVLVWSADLAHGGGEITDPSLTRRSLVGHYCPAGVEPYYFAYRSRRRVTQSFEGRGIYSSSYYPVR